MGIMAAAAAFCLSGYYMQVITTPNLLVSFQSIFPDNTVFDSDFLAVTSAGKATACLLFSFNLDTIFKYTDLQFPKQGPNSIWSETILSCTERTT